MSNKKKLKHSLEMRWCICVKTREPARNAYDGIVTHLTREYVVLREESELEMDGIVVLPRREIRGVRNSKYERCTNAILRENGELDALSVPSWLDTCKTLHDIFSELHRSDTWPAVEVVYRGRTRNALYLGPLTQVTKKFVTIRCYDAAGEWEDESRLAYDKIVRVEIESAYCRHFNAYMRGRGGTQLAVAPEPRTRG